MGGGVRQPPAHCTGTGPPFRGKTGLLSPPRPGREFRDENANESGSSAIFVAMTDQVQATQSQGDLITW